MTEIRFNPRGSLAKRLRNYFATGMLVLVPIALTVFIIIRLFQWIDGILRDTVFLLGLNIGDKPIPGVGFVALILLIIVVGLIARNYIGKQIIALGDKIVTRIPIINRIYITIQQISQAFLGEHREVFKKAVIFEYPRLGVYSIGFFTQDTKGLVQDNISEDVVSIIVLTVPNPTSGFLVFVPKDQVVELDMPVEEALKLVISGGSIVPKSKYPKIL